ncbi:MAG: hypothetical protein KDD38_04775 [Bdellovibrionales bacterium]|nr:hypothetical protein [Bdellovibrionales bacterium]
MSQFIENLQYKIKTSSGSILLMLAKLFVGSVIGLTFALIGEQMAGFGTFGFILVIISTIVTYMRVARSWTFTHLGVFSLICVLLAVLLKMYIQVAPGA